MAAFALTAGLPLEQRQIIWRWLQGRGPPPTVWLTLLDYEQLESLHQWAYGRHWGGRGRVPTSDAALRVIKNLMNRAALYGGNTSGTITINSQEHTSLDATQIINQLAQMAYSPLRNYIVPGLTSQLIAEGPKGKVRVFLSDRDQVDHITPHSHRFDFTCLVLKGGVVNTLYEPAQYGEPADLFALGLLAHRANLPGEGVMTPGTQGMPYKRIERQYSEQQTYAMKATQIHSIRFLKGSVVLFFEGPQLTDTSVVLEPWSDGQRVPTYGVQPWMFQRED